MTAILGLFFADGDEKHNEQSSMMPTAAIAHRNPSDKSEPVESQHIYDRSSSGDVLVGKVDPQNAPIQNLWLRNVAGKERLIAQAVMEAKFSPDGSKFAYATARQEVFVETLSGERLAEIPRASEPSWGVESATLGFVAIPSADYPEVQQQAVYDLNSGQVAEPKNKH